MPKSYMDMKIQQLFFSPMGYHLFVQTGTNEYVYFHGGTVRGKRLSKWKSYDITCIGWNAHETETQTKEILLGCVDGRIFETCMDSGSGEDPYFTKVYQVSDHSEIIGLYMKDVSEKTHHRYIIVVTKTRIEYFTGKMTLSNKMSLTLNIFHSGQREFQTFETLNSHFSISPIPWIDDEDANDRFIAWLSNQSLFYGSLKMFDIHPQDIFNFSFTHLPLDTIHQAFVCSPFFFCFTHYHIIIVQKDNIYIINRLSHQIVITEKIPLASEETILGLITDTYQSTYWIYSKEFLYEIVLSNEDGDVWRSFLKNNDYIKALKFAKPIIHNTLLSLLAGSENQDESSLLQYLEWEKSRNYYNSDFALRTCLQYKRVLSAVYLYSTMGFFEDAVKLALEYDNIDLACISADKTDDQILRKKLWIEIAKKVINQSNEGDIKSSLEFLMKNKLLHIEDIISLYPDFIKIDNFKEEICSVLKEYSSNIDDLLKKMEALTQSADNIRQNIEDHNKWFVILNKEEKCNICQKMLLNDLFYVFPCQHCFHKDCLYSRMLEETTFWQYRQIQDLQSRMSKPESDISVKSLEKCRSFDEELDDIISAECILCSSNMIRSIDKSFIDNNSKEISFWNI
ncbi:hypothetical protein PCK2_000284 [Pneumocystis canis]|nr:hypothetical protein PCK2_000284 [Pneumocystis canis]